MPARWALSLSGHPFDQEDAETLFGGEGPVRVAKVADRASREWTALFSDAFEECQTPSDVNEIGPPIVDRLNGILFVRDPGRQPLSIDAVLECRDGEPAEGGGFARSVFLAASGALTVRSRLSGTLSAGPSTLAPPPPERGLLALSLADDVLADVLTFLRGAPDWFDLYKAYEMMRDDIQRRLGKNKKGKNKEWYESSVAWPSRNAVTHFQKSANFHRHSRANAPEGVTTENALPLDAAKRFVAALVPPWCAWRGSSPGGL